MPLFKALTDSQLPFPEPASGVIGLCRSTDGPEGRGWVWSTIVLCSALPPSYRSQVPGTISPIPACRHLSSFLKLERSCPSAGFLHHLPDLALEIQRCTFEGRSLLPCATCRQFWGSVGSSRAMLQAMLLPGGVSRRCGSLRPGAPKPQVQACL